MRNFIDIIEEGLVQGDYLYHWTKLSHLLEILETNMLRANTHQQLGDRKKGVSFTRSPHSTLIRGNIILVMDAQKLRHHWFSTVY